MSKAQQRRRLRIRGRVQGVAFRIATRDAAARVGAHGWVCNREDGSVEAVVEGSDAQVEAVLAFCREGPRFARVDVLDVQTEAPEGLQGFTIR
ncbi:MAG: acylphosphatase [bacterium]|nr:acylphosphatase [bacterium]MCP5071162.1 acylphosphatase [bacterium]